MIPINPSVLLAVSSAPSSQKLLTAFESGAHEQAMNATNAASRKVKPEIAITQNIVAQHLHLPLSPHSIKKHLTAFQAVHS